MKVRLLFCLSFLFLFAESGKAQDKSILDKIDVFLFKGDYTDAINELNKIIGKDSSISEILFKLGLAYQGNYENYKANKLFRKAVLLDSNLTYLSALAKSYDNLGFLDQAMEYYLKIVERDSSNRNNFMNLAKIYLEKQKFKNAADIYLYLLNKDTTNSYLYKQLGYCMMKADSFNLALKYYQKAFELNNEDPNISVQMSTICFSLGRIDSALQYVNAGLKILPEEINYNKLKADILFKKGIYINSKDLYLKVINLGDSTATIYQKLGLSYYFIAACEDSSGQQDTLLYYRIENYTNALEAFEKAFILENNNPITCYYAGLTCDKLGFYELEIFYFNEAISLIIPEYTGSIYKYLGRAYQLKEKYENAISAYKKALFYNPDLKDLPFYIAVIYETNLKDYGAALNYYQILLNEKDNVPKDFRDYAQKKIKELKKKLK